MSELLPCPFCGGKAELTKHFREEIYNLLHRCDVVGPISRGWGMRASHVKAWNTRTKRKEGK